MKVVILRVVVVAVGGAVMRSGGVYLNNKSGTLSEDVHVRAFKQMRESPSAVLIVRRAPWNTISTAHRYLDR